MLRTKLNPTSGNISEGTQNTNSKEHKHPCVHCSVIYHHQDMEAAQVSLGHLHNGIQLGCKKNFFLKEEKHLPFATVCMDGPGEHYA